jgi:hypothetical protein
MSRLVILASTAAVIIAPHAADAQRRKQVTPYIEVGQVLTADLENGGDVLTYTSVAAGIDASVQTRRMEAQISYRYEHRFAWNDNLADDSVHSGLARASFQVTPVLQIEGGAIATRARTDLRGAAPVGNLAGNVRNISQIYSAYAGPTLSTNLGPASVTGAYRFGYTKVESSDRISGLPAGQQPLDLYDHSTSHLAVASIGTRAGTVLPVGLTLSGAWSREDASQLDQRYDGKYARLDAVLPVAPTVAVVGGVGYEKIEISQRDPLLTATGAAVVDGNGRYVTNQASPRRLAYDFDGLYWDAGVTWRPSRRTMLEARVGRRYGTMSYTGSLTWAMSTNSGLQVGVYDSVQSFGRGVSNALAALPTSFETQPDPFGSNFSGCVFGTEGDAAGGCLNPVLGGITTANFRARGVDGVLSMNRGPWQLGVGAGYANRRYLVPLGAGGDATILRGVDDDIYYGQAFLGRALDARSAINANLYATYTQSGTIDSLGVWGAGANGAYTYTFGRFGALASAGVFASDIEGPGGKDVQAQGALGMRYSF